MASRYTSTLTVPDGFPEMLKDFAREVLRQQPVNIYEFGARYVAVGRSGEILQFRGRKNGRGPLCGDARRDTGAFFGAFSGPRLGHSVH